MRTNDALAALAAERKQASDALWLATNEVAQALEDIWARDTPLPPPLIHAGDKLLGARKWLHDVKTRTRDVVREAQESDGAEPEPMKLYRWTLNRLVAEHVMGLEPYPVRVPLIDGAVRVIFMVEGAGGKAISVFDYVGDAAGTMKVIQAVRDARQDPGDTWVIEEGLGPQGGWWADYGQEAAQEWAPTMGEAVCRAALRYVGAPLPERPEALADQGQRP